ncbi:MAG: hypothetical protein MJ151_00820, partial [Lachnospiraceae bacterium]|nr:hypothetical protein [Lachnospiraceae bacterium]
MDKTLYCYVSVDLSVENLDKPFLYKLKKGQEKTIHVGDKVVFPFGRYNKENEGYILGIETENDILNNPIFKDEEFLKEEGALDKIKYITGLAENKLGTTNLILDLALYMSKEYMTSLSTCIKTCMPVKRHIRKNKRTYDVVERYEKEIKLVDFNEEQKIIIDDLTYAYDNDR